MKATWLVALVVLGVPSLATAEPLNVRLGLWEVTSTGHLAGTPPEAKHISTAKYCYSKAERQDWFETPPQLKQGKCTEKRIKETASEVVREMVCSDGMGGRFQYQAIDTQTVRGNVQLKTPQGNVTGTVSAKWLSADCGKYK